MGPSRARGAGEPGAALPEAVLLEAIELGWMTVLNGTVVQVLHAAAKLQEQHRDDALDRADDDTEFELEDELPPLALTTEVPSASPRGPSRFAEEVLARPVRTYRDVGDLCLGVGLIERARSGVWRVRRPLPAPVQVLAFDDEERPFHDHHHWRRQLPETIRGVVRVFVELGRGGHHDLPFDRDHDRLSCNASLYWWCQRMDAHPEAVRAAARELVDTRGFGAHPPPDRLFWDEPFRLTVSRHAVG